MLIILISKYVQVVYKERGYIKRIGFFSLSTWKKFQESNEIFIKIFLAQWHWKVDICLRGISEEFFDSADALI
jgi:hypothetical protein